jgi:hypothetical protein
MSIAGYDTTLGVGSVLNSTTSYNGVGYSATTSGIGATSCDILAGTLGASTTGISMAWRSRTSQELPAYVAAHGGLSGGYLPVYSDVVNLTGVNGGSNSVFALGMTYDPNAIGSRGYVDFLAAEGQLFLGYRSLSDGIWHNATTLNGSAAFGGGLINDGDTSQGSFAESNFQGSFAAYTASVGGGFTLRQALGSWGVDTTNNQVWAVIDHDAEFAVVPEPGSLTLFGAITAAVIAYRWGRRRR